MKIKCAIKIFYSVIYLLVNSFYLIGQKTIRSEYKNEIYASIYYTDIPSNHYSLGYEKVFYKKKDFFSFQNEFSVSIFPKTANDKQRILSLIKWNRQRNNIVSLGLGFSYRLNYNPNKFSFLLNNAYKYDFKKYKLTFTGNIFLFVTPLKPIPPSVFIPGSICISDCHKWNNFFRLSASIGKYF
jgi:hypothetical protein